jgi:hypothetical protein
MRLRVKPVTAVLTPNGCQADGLAWSEIGRW